MKSCKQQENEKAEMIWLSKNTTAKALPNRWGHLHEHNFQQEIIKNWKRLICMESWVPTSIELYTNKMKMKLFEIESSELNDHLK